MTIKFAVVPDAAHPECKPLATLSGMLERDALPTFAFLWGLTDNGDCHEIAEALSNDLTDNLASPRDEWNWIMADCERIGSHSWLECDGWAIDASNGKTRPVIIQRAADYRRAVKVKRVTRSVCVTP
jgi:hypothetical protein